MKNHITKKIRIKGNRAARAFVEPCPCVVVAFGAIRIVRFSMFYLLAFLDEEMGINPHQYLHQQIGVDCGNDIIGHNSPAAFQFLRKLDRPRLRYIKNPEQGKSVDRH